MSSTQNNHGGQTHNGGRAGGVENKDHRRGNSNNFQPPALKRQNEGLGKMMNNGGSGSNPVRVKGANKGSGGAVSTLVGEATNVALAQQGLGAVKTKR